MFLEKAGISKRIITVNINLYQTSTNSFNSIARPNMPVNPQRKIDMCK